MANNKLAVIGGSGLYDVEEFKDRELLEINTPWGKPSDKNLKTNFKDKEVFFLPRHGRGHFINPSNINFLLLVNFSIIVLIGSSGPSKAAIAPYWIAALTQE